MQERASVYHFSQTRTNALVTVVLNGTCDKESLDIQIDREHIEARRRLLPLPELPSSPAVERDSYILNEGGSREDTVETFILGSFFAPVKTETVHWTLQPLKQSQRSVLSAGIPFTVTPSRRRTESEDGEGSSEGGSSSYAMVSTPDMVSEEEHHPAPQRAEKGSRSDTWTESPENTALDADRLQKAQAGSSRRADHYMLLSVTFDKASALIWPRLIQSPGPHLSGPIHLALDGTSWSCLGEHYLDDQHNMISSVEPLLFASLQPYRHLVAQSRLLCDVFQFGQVESSVADLSRQSRLAALEVLAQHYKTITLSIAQLTTVLALDVAAAYQDSTTSLPQPPSKAHTNTPQRFARKLLTRVRVFIDESGLGKGDISSAIEQLNFDPTLSNLLNYDIEPLEWMTEDISTPLPSPEAIDSAERLAGSALSAASGTSSQEPLLESKTGYERRQLARKRRRRRKEQEKERENIRKKLLGNGDDASRHTRLIYLLAGLSVVIVGLAVWRKKRKS